MNTPLGVENYIDAIKTYYVDKTNIISVILNEYIGKTLLITRPRRFGKSLMLSMLDEFFNINKDNKQYFIDKKISQNKEIFINNINNHPVVHINMKNISADNMESMKGQIIKLVSSTYFKYRYITDGNKLLRFEVERFNKYLNGEYKNICDYQNSIYDLCEMINHFYDKRVILLIDEYDRPLDSAYQNDFYDAAIKFFSEFYSSSLKANEYLLFSVVTGVLQISKDSIFSKLNNLNVASVDKESFNEYFGFNEEEVLKILQDYQVDLDINEVRKWYGGYGFGKGEIYNPWSIFNLVENKRFDLYWVNTGSNQIVIDLIKKTDNAIPMLNNFVNNTHQSFSYNSAISYKDITNSYESLFSFLVQSGYLIARYDGLSTNANLYLPNKEISEAFNREIINRAINNNPIPSSDGLKKAIRDGNTNEISTALEQYIVGSFSYFDLNREKDYQMLIMGILYIFFDEYVIQSELVSKQGRADIFMLPKNDKQPGIVIELKYYNSINSKRRLMQYAKAAVEQIKTKKYYRKMSEFNVRRILLYGFVFDKNNTFIELEEINA